MNTIDLIIRKRSGEKLAGRDFEFPDVIESVLFLKGKLSDDLKGLTFALGIQILDMAGISKSTKKLFL